MRGSCQRAPCRYSCAHAFFCHYFSNQEKTWTTNQNLTEVFWRNSELCRCDNSKFQHTAIFVCHGKTQDCIIFVFLMISMCQTCFAHVSCVNFNEEIFMLSFTWIAHFCSCLHMKTYSHGTLYFLWQLILTVVLKRLQLTKCCFDSLKVQKSEFKTNFKSLLSRFLGNLNSSKVSVITSYSYAEHSVVKSQQIIKLEKTSKHQFSHLKYTKMEK